MENRGFRRALIRAAARWLKQWAERVLADEANGPVAPPSLPPASASPLLDQDAPPAHWAERVRRAAPELLRPGRTLAAPRSAPRPPAWPPPLVAPAREVPPPAMPLVTQAEAPPSPPPDFIARPDVTARAEAPPPVWPSPAPAPRVSEMPARTVAPAVNAAHGFPEPSPWPEFPTELKSDSSFTAWPEISRAAPLARAELSPLHLPAQPAGEALASVQRQGAVLPAPPGSPEPPRWLTPQVKPVPLAMDAPLARSAFPQLHASTVAALFSPPALGPVPDVPAPAAASPWPDLPASTTSREAGGATAHRWPELLAPEPEPSDWTAARQEFERQRRLNREQRGE